MSPHGEAVRSVVRALDILDALASGPRTVGTVARAIDLPKTTVYRLLLTLEQREVVSRGQSAEEFRLGPRLLYLGLQARAGDTLHELALPAMRELRKRYEETVNLNIRVGDERLCIASVEGVHSIRMTGVLGQRSPLHSGAAARAILAFLDDDEIERYLAHMSREPVAAGTIVNPDALRSVLRETRELGYAVSASERTTGVASVGAPIWNDLGEVVGSINISGPPDRLPAERLVGIGEAVRAAGRAISTSLGWVPTGVEHRALAASPNGARA